MLAKKFLGLILIDIFGLAPVSVVSQTTKPAWQTEWEKVVEAGRREGKVVVSLPPSAELRKQIEAGFAKRFDGIQLELIAAPGSASVNRILEEKKSGVHYFDLHVGGSSSIITGLLRADVLGPVLPWMILPEVRDAKNWWGGHIRKS